MSWTALNVELDSDTTEDEYDDTKEIQIEEAIKLYQNALKLHAQGPAYFHDAEKAYKELFESEIFTYPESRSQYRRLAEPDSVEDSDFESGPVGASIDTLERRDMAPDTLSQVLFLSYKNYGQFLLDRLVQQNKKAQYSISESERADARDDSTKVMRRSLQLLVNAVEKDETDTDLWIKVAKVGRYLGSKRIARWAIESYLAVRSEEDTAYVRGTNPEVMWAQMELTDLLRSNGEEPPPSISGKQTRSILRVAMDPFPSLKPPPDATLAEHYERMTLGEPIILHTEQRSWESVGQILKQTRKEDSNGTERRFGLAFQIALPDDGEHAARKPITANLITAESLHKSRLSQSPTSPMKQSLFEYVSTPKSQVASPILRRKSFAASVENGTQQDSPEATDHMETTEVKPADNVAAAANQAPSELRPPAKRNTETAGLQDPPEGGRSRSKRLRARAETLAEDSVDPKILTKHYEEQLQEYVRADEWLFSIAFEMISRIVPQHNKDTLAFRSILSAGAGASELNGHHDLMVSWLVDFKSCLTSWNLNKSNLLLSGTGTGASVTLIDNGADSGFTTFLDHSRAGQRRAASTEEVLFGQDISTFIEGIAGGWNNIESALFLWVQALLKPSWNARPASDANEDFHSKYTKYVWPATLKDSLTQTLVDEDPFIYSMLYQDFDPLKNWEFPEGSSLATLGNEEMAMVELVQTIFELHLDIYGKMTSPDSKVDQPTRTFQRDRIGRWANLANIAVSRRDLLYEFEGKAKFLALRHLWSYVVFVSFVESQNRDHILLCYQDLRRNLEEDGSPVYYLINNAIMPEISAEALERETSKEKTMDFFASIFGTNAEDPSSLIENLEPVLMETRVPSDRPQQVKSNEQEIKDSQGEDVDTQTEDLVEDSSIERQLTNGENNQLVEFLQKGTAQLRLSLWHQLKTAYHKINYSPMEFVCNIRCMDIIIKELQSSAYAGDDHENRLANLIVWVRNLADLTSQCLEIAKANASALDCLAEDNLKIALSSFVEVVKLLHVFAVWEDSVRIGQVQPPHQPPGAVVAHKSSMTLLREMQPKVWHLLYLICLDAATQYSEDFPTLVEDRLEFLRATHKVFGLREYCRLGRKSLLKFMKTELLKLSAPEDEISQVLYDLYNLKLGQNSSGLQEHGCTGDQIDRASALEIVPFVITQTDRMNIKDVLKSDLKAATERMQAVIGMPRGTTPQQAFNRKTVLNFLKSPIVPMNLFRSLRGLTELNSMSVKTEFAVVAHKKWFFLIGHIHLAKHRSQKRVTRDTSDDLEKAEKFLKMDLEFNGESWETWYRLAQTFDAKIDEDVTWDAESINDPSSDLVAWQKQAIHCYEMAVSLATRYAESTFETTSRLSELYSDFASRIYSSSRAPFSMKVFSLKGHERFFNRAGVGTFKKPPSTEVKSHMAWKLAAEMYRKALEEKPDTWGNWYMLGKCRWKQFQSPDVGFVGWREPVDAFVKAIQCLPEKRDNRHPEKDPILEPHYKLVSTVYKLVSKGHILPNEGVHILDNSQFARKIPCENPNNWEPYILGILKALRNVDKAGWHHRIVLRTAHIVYDDHLQILATAQAAKDKLAGQIFTKSMTVQVWKPEFERAGRHFVYMSQYVSFFIRLLEQLGDRPSLEMLGKRIRKRQSDFLEHDKIWKSLSQAHLRLLRIQGSIPSGHEDTIFKSAMPFEVFTLNANRLETWSQSQLSLSHPTLALLQEAVELKRLNGTLLDKAPFDDLIADIYARIYEQVVPELIARAGEAENRERMRIERMLMDAETPQPGPSAGDTAAPSGRTKTVSRTEVRKRAEAMVVRPGVLVGRGRGAASGAEPSTAGRGRRPSGLHGPPELQAPPSDAENAASMHDDADDESELTEIDEDLEDQDETEEEEEEPKAPIFPNLAAQPNGVASRDTTVSAEPRGEMDGVVAS